MAQKKVYACIIHLEHILVFDHIAFPGLAPQIPGGTMEPGEVPRQAIFREVVEETGWRCLIETELPRSQYWFHRAGRRVKKTVRWFRMSPIEEVGQPDQEIDERAWVSIQEAKDILTYHSDRKLLENALAQIKDSTPA